jgi:hypothetical protein
MQPVTERCGPALEHHQLLGAQQNRSLRRAKPETQPTKRLPVKPRFRFEAALQVIEISERYGTLKERAAILLLADALCHANDELEQISGC